MAQDERLVQVHKTFDHGQFKLLYGNRKVNEERVKHLMESIQKKNLLHYVPILVNKDKYVIDGQTRLKAAEKLHFPIYYIQGDDTAIMDIILLNAYNKSWEAQDYLQLYIKMGKQDYKIIQAFMNKYHFTTSNAIAALTMRFHTMGTLFKEFKNGDYVVTHKKEAEQLGDDILQLQDGLFFPDLAFKDREFLRAYTIIQQSITINDLIGKLKLYNLKLVRQVNKMNYIRQFEDIMNFRMRKKVYRFI